MATSTPTGEEVPARSAFRLGNRPPLTGIRAPLVIAVMVFHANFSSLPGSWAMLQTFFCLSGFLITAVLSNEAQRRGRIAIGGFYGRRLTRLVPPLLLTVGLLAIYASLVQVPDAAQRVWGDSAAALFYYADYRQAFGHAPFFGYLAQTWSLSVEEQFYVVWSLLMVAAVAVGRRRLAYGFAVAGIALSLADRLVLTYGSHPFSNAAFDRVYYAFDSRADALFLGCLLGLLASDGYLDGWGPRARQLLGAAALVSVAFLGWILVTSPLYHQVLVVWWLPLSSLASACIIAHLVVSPVAPLAKLFSLGILVFIGEISYTLYLVHFPVYLAIFPGASGTHWSFWFTEIVRLVVIFAIAIASWYLLERPLMRWRHRAAERDRPPVPQEVSA